MEQRRIEDMRAFKLLAVHLKETPEPGDLFPSLREYGKTAEQDVDDSTIFQQVSSSLMPYAGK